ncbi:MAG: nucleotidyl transferase AbiEii/AbiGii toxin family protein [Planctomycetaceae bacterium]|nr:nucleotidyl transferase AbiEii/AbiGii toxin family protein [Planctomycetaceae bacterium]
MSDTVRNMARSVHDRLLKIAKEKGRPYNDLQQRFAMERFLYRLSSSPFAGQFTLKGALALLAWTGSGRMYRPTMDIDLLGHTSNEAESLVKVFQAVAAQDVPIDGLVFDAQSVTAVPITEDAEYNGMRVRLTGRMGNARISIQIDIGFSDRPIPKPQRLDLPGLLDFPGVSMMGYRPESSIAEKLQAMVARDVLNSRMKDFADIWHLAQGFAFEGSTLAQAIVSTFERRNTPIPANPTAFSNEFAHREEKQAQWAAFVRRSAPTGVPDNFVEVVAGVAAFLGPVLAHLADNQRLPQRWQAPGPWQH